MRSEMVRTALRDLLERVPREMQPRLIERTALLIEQERERCIELCRQRSELWRKTSAAQSSVAFAREEARARANEALYLADLLASDSVLGQQP